MKYKLSIPDLTIKDLSKLNFIALFFGYNFKYEFVENKIRKAFFEKEDKNIGYIQKDKFGKVFIVWKYDESIEYMEPLFDIVGNMKKFNIIPDNLGEKIDNIKMAIGINELTHSTISDKNKEYLCLTK